MKKPKNMPPYPTKKQVANGLITRKKQLLSDLLFFERSQVGGDFRNFRHIVKIRKELKVINDKIDLISLFC